jgi:hypothetical protein
MAAIEGPFRSASSTATRAPASAKAPARLAVIEDLPTPPLPETTATTAFTSRSRCPSRACWASTWPTMFEPPSPPMSR